MGAGIKIFIGLLALFLCLQLTFAARLPRQAKDSKSSSDLDVKELGNLIMTRLKDSLKDGNESVGNILNRASDALNRNGALRAAMNALL